MGVPALLNITPRGHIHMGSIGSGIWSLGPGAPNMLPVREPYAGRDEPLPLIGFPGSFPWIGESAGVNAVTWRAERRRQCPHDHPEATKLNNGPRKFRTRDYAIGISRS